MATAAAVLAEAASHLGYIEGPRNNETPFGAWAGAQFQPWCASFVSKILDDAGMGIGKITYVPSMVVHFRDRDRLFSTPKVGDVFCLWFPSKGRYAHTGFVKAVDGDWIITNEGNSNKAGSRTGGQVVSLRRQWRGTRTVFGRPGYDSASVPTPAPQPLPARPWRYDDVNIAQHPVRVTLDANGNGYADAPCPIEKVVGEARLNGTIALYDKSPTLRFETYGFEGRTRIEVVGGVPKGALDFVVSAVAS